MARSAKTSRVRATRMRVVALTLCPIGAVMP
jgi:hypothetical protein